MNTSLPVPLTRRAFAWGVHLFTASGVVWGLLSILAIYQHQWKLAFLWVAATLIVDGFDGTLARLAHVKEYAPNRATTPFPPVGILGRIRPRISA